MPYVKRNEQGIIVEMYSSVDEDSEWVDPGHPQVLDFLSQPEKKSQAKNVLTATDHDMVRVVEDLVDLLMEKQIFIFTELPEAVQAKLNARRQLRKDLNSLEGLISDDEPIF